VQDTTRLETALRNAHAAGDAAAASRLAREIQRVRSEGQQQAPQASDPRDLIPTDEPGTGGFVTREQAAQDSSRLQERADERNQRGQAFRRDLSQMVSNPAGYIGQGMVNFVGNVSQQPIAEQNFGQALGQSMPAAQLALQGATFGFGDELVGGAAAGGAALTGGDAGEAYRRNTDAARAEIRSNREAAPVSSFVAEATGGALVPVSGGSGFIGNASTTGGRIARTAAVGGGAGALTGAGESDGDLGDRALGATAGGALGALLGPAVSESLGFVGRQAGRMGSRLADEVDDASDAAVRFAGRSGVTRELRQNPAALSGDGFLAERLGSNTRQTASGIAGLGGQAQDVAEDAISERAAGRANRVSQAVSTATESGGRTPIDNLMQLDDVRAAARPLFNAADDVMVDLSQNPQASANVRRNIRRLQRADVTFARADRLAEISGEPRVALANFGGDAGEFPSQVRLGDIRALARTAEERAGVLYRQGSGEEGRAISNAARELRDFLRSSSPEYREAAQIWHSAARDEQAFEMGQSILRPGAQGLRDVRRFVNSGTSQTERRMFLSGIADQLERRMGNITEGGNVAAPINRRLIRARVQEFLGEDAANELMETLNREMDQSRFETLVNREVGSQTDARTAGRERVRRAAAGGLRNMLGELVENPLELLRGREGRRALAQTIRSGDDEAIAEVARILYSEGDLSSDPLVRRLLAEARRRGVDPRLSAGSSALVGQESARQVTGQ